jgi:hypothetical protein
MGNSDSDLQAGGSDAATQTTSFQVSKEPVVRPKSEADVHKFDTGPAPETREAPHFEQLGELPRTYGEKTIYLIARDPHWLFTYWDVDGSEYPASSMRGGEHKFFLKLTGGTQETLIEVNLEARNWYIPVSKSGVTFTAELGYFDPAGAWQAIVASNEAAVPSDALSDTPAYDFATVPFHLTFQRLVDMVKATMATGESLIQALSRLQGEGRRLAFAQGTPPDWTDEQKSVLAALVGEDLVSKIASGSGQIDQLLRKQLEEKLNTESASFLSEKGRLSELLKAAESSWGPAESSLFSALGASWNTALGASWSTALGASWSTAPGASWSAQPFSAPSERGFFMHVNAEVIFYGGTHPDATVWIDGKQTPLKPDGTFRYHFKFPDADFEIPIVAQSPDNLEQRSATLSFKRATGRKGDVGATAQPHDLETPMGQKH